jgi:hypothetical protein
VTVRYPMHITSQSVADIDVATDAFWQRSMRHARATH